MSHTPNDLEFLSLVITPSEPSTAEFATLHSDPGVTPDTALPGTEALLLRRGGVAVARASLFVASGLVGTDKPTGLIGHYEAIDQHAGVTLLQHAASLLAQRGVSSVLGPMNGSTWMRYRFALPQDMGDSGADRSWFAGEPANAPDYPSHWLAAGFRVAELYESASEDLAPESVATAEQPQRGALSEPASADFRIRQISMDRFSEELTTLHRLSIDAFARNAFYSPIDLDTFRALYAPFAARLDPGFVLLAERSADEPLGFVFAYPDPLSLHNGKPTRLIVKTLAVSSAARGLGISSRLLDCVRDEARDRGFLQVISSLMRADNASVGMAARRHATLFRRYALYERDV